jgi:hypothetical protein
VSTNVTLHAGHDVAYFTSGQGRGGCAGAMSYYTAAGEPPGEWAGKGGAALGLAGQVDPAVIGRLYQHGIGPGGEQLVGRRRSEAAGEREAAAVAAYRAAHPYASVTELAEARAAERGEDPHQVPYFDLTVSAVKSVSVLHASYRVSARQAREHGDDQRAAALDAKADQIEDALMDAAHEAVAWLEQHATYTRTGHHSARTGEWRDGDGLVASLFLHHLSRDGDPSCTCTSRSGTGSSAATAPTANGAPWTPAPCTTSGSASRRSPTAAWRPGCPPSGTPWCRGQTGTAPRSAGSART